jgi:serine phosphatase RsbU (regulator of sigma subunit)
VLDLGTGGLAVVCGDVSGHGPDPAALGAQLRVSWQALVRSGAGSAALVDSLRDVVVRERRNPETFVTMCLAWIDVGRDELHLLNIGHPPPFSVPRATGRSGDVDAHEIQTAPLLPLGSLDQPVPDPEVVSLPPGWQLFFYTDGLVEGRMADGESERYGEERLAAELHASRETLFDETALADLVERIEQAGAGSFADDVTVVVIAKTR